MGRSYQPKYRVEAKVVTKGQRYTDRAGWDYKECGTPSDAALAAYCTSMDESTLPGGANEHLGPQETVFAQVVNQDTYEVVARYSTALFEAA